MADMRGIDLNLLIVLDALLDERSVTRAAARLGYTQPTIAARRPSSTSTGPNVVCSGILWSLLAVASTARLKWANRLLTSTPKSARLLLRTDAG
jgi:hypothetical protein